MFIQLLMERIAKIAKAIEESAANHQAVSANHNALVGRHAEAKELLDALKAANIPGTAEEVIDAVDAVASAVETVIDDTTTTN